MTVEERGKIWGFAAQMLPECFEGEELAQQILKTIIEFVVDAEQTERERCAKVCEQTHAELDAEYSPEGCAGTALVAAQRIREGTS